MIKFLTCGNVDDGKSTLIGRLLYDTNSLFEDQIEEVKNNTDSNFEGGLDFSLFLDGLTSERSQKITIDVAYRYFYYQNKKMIIADSPGHEQYTRNMAVAASNSDYAIILIDAAKGVKTQTIRHSYIVNLFGIKNIIVAINKMDLVGHSENIFNLISKEYREKIKDLNFNDIRFIPIVAKEGTNIAKNAENTELSWYSGKTIIDNLIEFDTAYQKSEKDVNEKSARFLVQNLVKHTDKRYYQGFLSKGSISVGDKFLALPTNDFVEIKEIIHSERKADKVSKNSSISVLLDKEIDLERGGILSSFDNILKPFFSNSIKSKLIWFHEEDFIENNKKEFLIKINANYIRANIKKINNIINVDNLTTYQGYILRKNQIADIDLLLEKKIAFDSFESNKHTGAFLLIDPANNSTVAAGIIESSTDIDIIDLTINNEMNKEKEFIKELSTLIKKYFGNDKNFDFTI